MRSQQPGIPSTFALLRVCLLCCSGLLVFSFVGEVEAAPNTTRLQRVLRNAKKVKKKKLSKKAKAAQEKMIARNLDLLMHMKMLKKMTLYRHLGLIKQMPPATRRHPGNMLVQIRRTPPRWGMSKRPSRKQRN